TTSLRRQVRQETPLAALAQGLKVAARDRHIRVIVLLFGAKGLGRGSLNVLLVAVPLELLALPHSGAGYLTAAVGAGGVIGATAAPRLVGDARLAAVMGLGLAVFGLPWLGIVALPAPAVAAIAIVAVGVGNTLIDVGGLSVL